MVLEFKAPKLTLILILTKVCLPESPVIIKVNKAFYPLNPILDVTSVLKVET
jgi:hypothetical protein